MGKSFCRRQILLEHLSKGCKVMRLSLSLYTRTNTLREATHGLQHPIEHVNSTIYEHHLELEMRSFGVIKLKWINHEFVRSIVLNSYSLHHDDQVAKSSLSLSRKRVIHSYQWMTILGFDVQSCNTWTKASHWTCQLVHWKTIKVMDKYLTHAILLKDDLTQMNVVQN